jgi:hypothetical protein
MAAKGTQPELPENPLVAQLIAAGAENSRVLRGFIGPSQDKRYITLYQHLARLGDTVEISREDILYAMKAPRSDFGAVILWVKEDAQLSVRKPQSDAAPTTGPGSLQELAKGRLRMRMRSRQVADVCLSVCFDCFSWCDCNICETPV